MEESVNEAGRIVSPLSFMECVGKLFAYLWNP
jgi:hypothetical protein